VEHVLVVQVKEEIRVQASLRTPYKGGRLDPSGLWIPPYRRWTPFASCGVERGWILHVGYRWCSTNRG